MKNALQKSGRKGIDVFFAGKGMNLLVALFLLIALLTVFLFARYSVTGASAVKYTEKDSYVGEEVSAVVTVGNEKRIVLTKCDTVGELLDSLEVVLGEHDEVNYGMADAVTDGMKINVTLTDITYSVFEEPIPFETQTVYDSNRESGTKTVTQEGVEGVRRITRRTVVRNGETVEDKISAAAVLSLPVDEIITVGTKKNEPAKAITAADASTTAAEGVLTLADGTVLKYTEALSFKATAYTTERQSQKTTATGTVARVGEVAVDRSVIPLGTKLYIVAEDGTWTYGCAVAEDTGVKGYTVDLFMNTYDECIQFGVRRATVYILAD